MAERCVGHDLQREIGPGLFAVKRQPPLVDRLLVDLPVVVHVGLDVVVELGPALDAHEAELECAGDQARVADLDGGDEALAPAQLVAVEHEREALGGAEPVRDGAEPPVGAGHGASTSTPTRACESKPGSSDLTSTIQNSLPWLPVWAGLASAGTSKVNSNAWPGCIGPTWNGPVETIVLASS